MGLVTMVGLGVGSSILGGLAEKRASEQEAMLQQQQALEARLTSEYNQELNNLAARRKAEADNRQFARDQSSREVEIANTGLNINSKSFQQVRNEALQAHIDQLVRDKQDLQQRNLQERRRGVNQANQSEARARAARSRGNTALITSLANSVGKLSDINF